MSTPTPLSAQEIAGLRGDLAAGRQPVVWFTPVAVGVDPGRSAKVVALAEPAEGDFVQVRPTGSTDVLSFSPSELTQVKPPRRRKDSKPADPPAVASPAKSAQQATKEPTGELLVTRERPTRSPARKPALGRTAAQTAPTNQQRQSRTRQPAPVTVTLTSTPDGEWTVDVLAGKKRTIRAQPVSAASVAQAAKALGGEVAEAIEGVLTAARDQQRARVAQLESALQAARQALAELAD